MPGASYSFVRAATGAPAGLDDVVARFRALWAASPGLLALEEDTHFEHLVLDAVLSSGASLSLSGTPSWDDAAFQALRGSRDADADDPDAARAQRAFADLVQRLLRFEYRVRRWR